MVPKANAIQATLNSNICQSSQANLEKSGSPVPRSNNFSVFCNSWNQLERENSVVGNMVCFIKTV